MRRSLAKLRLIALTLLAVSAFAGTSHAQTTLNQTDCGYRDPRGRFDRHYKMPLEEHRRVIARMEEFTWLHWKNKTPGCFLTHFITAEGGTVDQSFFFENDESGVWRVRIERRELRTNYGPPASRFVIRTTKFVYSMQRVDLKQAGDTAKVFSDSEDIRPGTYNLEGRAKDGELFILWEPENVTN